MPDKDILEQDLTEQDKHNELSSEGSCFRITFAHHKRII